MVKGTPGRVVFVSRNGAMLVVENDNGFALVEMLGNEGEISVGARVTADWDAVASESMFLARQRFDVYLQGNTTLDEAVRLAREAGG